MPYATGYDTTVSEVPVTLVGATDASLVEAIDWQRRVLVGRALDPKDATQAVSRIPTLSLDDSD